MTSSSRPGLPTATEAAAELASAPRTPLGPGVGRLRLWLHVGALTSLAIAQPLFDELGRSAAFLRQHAVTTSELWPLTALVVLGPPSLALLGFLLVGRVAPQRKPASALVLVGGAAALALLPPGVRLCAPTSGPGALLLLVGTGAAGAVFAVGYARFAALREALDLLSASLLAFPLLFLTSTAAARLTPAAPPDPGVALQVTDPIPPDTPVVFVVLGGLPLTALLDRNADIDASRLPHFAALAGVADFYAHYTGVALDVDYALPALLSGRAPSRTALPHVRAYPVNLFTLLEGRYVLDAFETRSWLCPPQRCQRLGVPPRSTPPLYRDVALLYARLAVPAPLVTGLPDPRRSSWQDRPGPRLVQQQVRAHAAEPGWLFARFLETLSATTPETLYFIHLGAPRIPIEASTHADEAAAEDPVEQVDRMIGELVARLEALGLFERALIVVTSDVGTGFEASLAPATNDAASAAQGHRPPARPALDPGVLTPGGAAGRFTDWLRVPLFVKRPGQTRGRRIETPTRTTDVLPTVAAALGLILPVPVDGRAGGDPNDDGRVEVWIDANGARVRRVLEPESVALAPALERAVQRRRAGRDAPDGTGATPSGP